jgi:hypothetical protein
MKLYLLIILISIFLQSDAALSDDKQVDKDREIIEVLDILENYDFLVSMDLYITLEEIKNSKNIQSPDRDKEEGEKK